MIAARRPHAVPPAPARPLPPEIPTTEAIAAILAAACGAAPPPALLAGPAGVAGALAAWAPLLPYSSRSPAPHRLARATAAYATALRTAAREYPPAAGVRSAAVAAQIGETIAFLTARPAWLFGAPPPPPPRWHGAARALALTIRSAFDEAALPQPSGHHLAGAVHRLLKTVRVHVSLERVRNVMGCQRRRKERAGLAAPIVRNSKPSSRQEAPPMAQPRPRPDRILRKPEVWARTGLRDSQITRLEAAGQFPERIQLGPRSVGWWEPEIDSWVARRLAARKVRPQLAPSAAI